MRSLVGGAAAATAIVLATASMAAAEISPLDATDPLDPPLYYCPGSLDGGASGAVTDTEHTRVLGNVALPPGVTQHRVTIDGVSTVVNEADPADSPEAAVFVHGNPGSSRDWDDLLAATG